MPAKEKKPKVIIPETDVTTFLEDTKGPLCEGCPLVTMKRLPGAGPTTPVDIMIVSESPSWVSVGEKRSHFQGKGGRIIRETWNKLVKQDTSFTTLTRYDMYAVQCQSEPDDINKNVLERCSRYLKATVRLRRPKVILTFGANALKALGIKVGGRFDDVRGKMMTYSIDADTQATVLPTFSTRAILRTSGLYNLLMADMYRAMRIATGKDKVLTDTDISVISKDYRIPKTLEEVKELCDYIIEYRTPEGTPQNTALAVDTETNTLLSHHPEAKVICISFAWDVGKSCAIPLWHEKAPWTPAELKEVVGHVQRVLACPKPKVFHNWKFDGRFLELRHGFRINNVAWCTLLGEHLIREDQAGSYSLKILGRSYFPEFANYADHVHEMASSLSEEDQVISDLLDGYKTPSKSKKAVKKGVDEIANHAVFKRTELVAYLRGPLKDLKKRIKDSVNYEKVPLDDLLVYAAIDTDLTRRLLRIQWTRMAAENFIPQGRRIMANHCIPASRTLGAMEHRGVRVDQEYLKYLKAELPKSVETACKELRRHWDNPLWGDFNPNSTHHLIKLLYNEGVHRGPRWNPAWGEYSAERAQKLGNKLYTETEFNPATDYRGLHDIPGVTDVNTKSGQRPTDKKTLRAIVEHTMKEGNPCLFTVALLDYRSAHKAKSGFLTEIEHLSQLDGRLHTNFAIHGTSTGRTSSSGMNLQNWGTWIAGFNLKKLLIPDDPESEVILNLDYKGAEVKIFAAYSQDAALIDALNRGMDAHCFFMEKVYGIPYAEALAANEGVHPNPIRGKELKALRSIIKRVVFGILYGAGPKKIAETAGISMEKAQEVIAQLFDMFPSIRRYVENTRYRIKSDAFVQTFFGRRRRFPLHEVSSFFRSQAERRGVNMLIQSTSSDIVIGQLGELDQHIQEIGGRLALTVHDSMVAVVPKKFVSQLPTFLTHYCVDRVTEKYKWLPVRFACDIEVGPNYGECMPIDHYLEGEHIAAELVQAPDKTERLAAIKTGTDALVVCYSAKKADYATLSDEGKAGRNAANGKALYRATMLKMPDAERALNVDLEQRLEEQFDEEALEELRDFEDTNKEKPVEALKETAA